MAGNPVKNGLSNVRYSNTGAICLAVGMSPRLGEPATALRSGEAFP